jgi:L-fuculose-phosphate aldolase
MAGGWSMTRHGRATRSATRLLETARALHARGLVAGTAGNVSVRIGREILITPSRLPYERLSPRDVVAVAPDGRRLRGSHAPSRELPLHLEVYRARPDVGAIVHTHSPYATAWSFLDARLEPQTEDMDYYGVGAIRTVPPAPPGSQELAHAAAGTLGTAGAVLLGRHGVLAVGSDLDAARSVAEAVEHQAHVAWLLRGGDAAGRARRHLQTFDHLVG